MCRSTNSGLVIQSSADLDSAPRTPDTSGEEDFTPHWTGQAAASPRLPILGGDKIRGHLEILSRFRKTHQPFPPPSGKDEFREAEAGGRLANTSCYFSNWWVSFSRQGPIPSPPVQGSPAPKLQKLHFENRSIHPASIDLHPLTLIDIYPLTGTCGQPYLV
ncbi:hypothetical protein DL95DRAFT_404195 [Leptodontidium sp. 2 PMI_412]|nr:hypothetical protein DL95DRAFT_404195 [Leptodontidium sp. 2 PMI_412]